MNITNVHVTLSTKPESNRLATVSITIGDSLVLYQIGLIKRKDNDTMFLSMPSRRNEDGSFDEIYCHPINNETRDEMTEKVIEAYRKVVANPEERNVAFDAAKPLTLEDVRIVLVDRGNTIAYVSMLLDGGFVIQRMRIAKKTDGSGLYLAMPARKMQDETYVEVYHPITVDGRQVMFDTAKTAYDNMIKKFS